jgi:flavin reductase
MATEASDLARGFRDAMRRLAATVTVVSTHHEDVRHGMTATAVTSVSVEPATLLVCINQLASIHAPLLARRRFCVNLLHSGHAELSQNFAGELVGDARFAIGEWRAEDGDVPYLADAQANLFCDLDLAVPYATHTIVIGRVTAVRVRDEVAPLIYRDGGYAAAAALPTKR